MKPDVSSKKSKKKVIVGSDDEEDDDEVQFVSGETPNAKRKRADSDVKPEVSAKKEKNGKAKTKPKPKNGKVVKGKATTKKVCVTGYLSVTRLNWLLNTNRQQLKAKERARRTKRTATSSSPFRNLSLLLSPSSTSSTLPSLHRCQTRCSCTCRMKCLFW